MKEDITFNYKINIDEFSKVEFYLYKNHPYIYLIPIVVLIFILTKIFNSPTIELNVAFLFLVLITFFLIISVFFFKKSRKKKLLKNSRLKEQIFYTINDSYVEEKGDSFQIKHFWKDLYKTKETKDWYLIYVNKHRAIPLFKKQIGEESLHKLKELIISKKNRFLPSQE